MSKLLLIDDEEAIVRVLSLSLRADGHDVATALSGEEGLAVYRADKPDIVLTDIKMPGMDGIELLARIKEIDPDSEVIIITGHGDIDNAIEALKFGASDFINKPVRDEAITVALTRAEEKLSMKRQIKAYTTRLEEEVEKATVELRRRSNFMAKLIRTSNDGIVATDSDWRVVIFNPGAERIFGRAREEVIRKAFAQDLFPSDVMGHLEQTAHPGERGGELPWTETGVTVGEMEIPIRFSGTKLFEKQQMVGSVAFFQDLREVKRLERELVGAERLAAIGQTVAGVAHGVKNILHGFKGGSYLVDIGIAKDNPEKLKKGWGMVQRNINRTQDLVMDLLYYSKDREPEYEKCSPNEIAGDVVEMLTESAKEHDVVLRTEFDPSIGEVEMDVHTIHQALTNLVGNAVDACLFDEDTSKKWQVKVRTQREDDRFIRFEIIDNGAGMSDEVREKIFQSFFSTKGHRGTGLGLLVVRKVVEEHNGEIDVRSEPGKGTTFIVRLPYKHVTDRA